METVTIISDATGETVERMVRTATLQFSEPNVPAVLGVDPAICRKYAKSPVIDVTNVAIEETAADILRIYQEGNTQP